MFAHDSRCRYRSHQLAEVICQLRFPEILAIPANPPVEFQEAIRAEYPQFLQRQELPAPKVAGTPGNLRLQNSSPVINY